MASSPTHDGGYRRRRNKSPHLLLLRNQMCSSSMLLYVHDVFKFNVALRPRCVQVQCCFTIRTIREREPRTTTSTSTQLPNSDHPVQVQCCFTSTEVIRTVRNGTGSPGRPPGLSHSCWALTRIVQVQCCFTSVETVRTIRDSHLDFHRAPEP